MVLHPSLACVRCHYSLGVMVAGRPDGRYGGRTLARETNFVGLNVLHDQGTYLRLFGNLSLGRSHGRRRQVETDAVDILLASVFRQESKN